MNKPTDLLVILTTAVLTALIATPILTPAVSHAEGERVFVQNQRQNGVVLGGFINLAPATMNGAPLLVDGLELTLKLDQESYKPGEKPVLTLIAVNKTDKKRKTKAKVLVSSTARSSRLMRSMPMPVTVYKKEVEIEVAAGQTLKLPLETGHAGTPNSMVSLTISVGELFQHAGSFAVAAAVQTEERVQTVKTVQLDAIRQVTEK